MSERVTGWLPIETAPKDGTWFLAYVPDSPMAWAPYEFCAWSHHYKQDANGDWTIPVEPGYWCETDTSEELVGVTHWQPLPPPPSED